MFTDKDIYNNLTPEIADFISNNEAGLVTLVYTHGNLKKARRLITQYQGMYQDKIDCVKYILDQHFYVRFLINHHINYKKFTNDLFASELFAVKSHRYLYVFRRDIVNNPIPLHLRILQMLLQREYFY